MEHFGDLRSHLAKIPRKLTAPYLTTLTRLALLCGQGGLSYTADVVQRFYGDATPYTRVQEVFQWLSYTDALEDFCCFVAGLLEYELQEGDQGLCLDSLTSFWTSYMLPHAFVKQQVLSTSGHNPAPLIVYWPFQRDGYQIRGITHLRVLLEELDLGLSLQEVW